MIPAEDEVRIRETHERYYQALSDRDMDALAANFAFPASFKGFLESVVVATDKTSLAAAFDLLIAATPKSERTEIRSMDASYLRPNTYMLDTSYVLYDASDTVVHDGRAIYFMNRVENEVKIFAIV
ncbi:MAG: hypothetical protein P8M73_05130 [Luminiphilus sp.]|jgi:hypothetical protein|nr:hypothetical protein [Luminiphilus sp.]